MNTAIRILKTQEVAAQNVLTNSKFEWIFQEQNSCQV